ncbi:transcription factor bHLH144-like [Cucurbita moschata]|uniref:Transcription factor bHLH144-like n=1 Tax=Cucurbita moschata TaxID=3662 RepID=A0A6J1EHT0_CUCMO|nr:transcription factor bHLH144-like [Cucurbita moschata]XP_022926348.1 transcription factor bHLH144-like [Cucurbita moschata]
MDFMQSDLNCYLKEAMLPTANQGDGDHMQIPLSSAFPSVLPPGRKNLGPFNAVEFQPSEICSQNFIIFDHTDDRSQIMFHPAICNKLGGPTANYEDREIPSPLMEDEDDIDALLSLEDEDHEDVDGSEDDEINSARSQLNYGNRSPDSSSSSYSSKPRKNQSVNPVHTALSSGSSCDGDMKQLKLKKMVKKLREILPGGYQMTTAMVLDEAVKYLKSLKDEVQELGLGSLEN